MSVEDENGSIFLEGDAAASANEPAAQIVIPNHPDQNTNEDLNSRVELRRRRNAIHSRKKRARKKAAEESLVTEHDSLVQKNNILKLEHRRLQHLVTQAVDIICHLENHRQRISMLAPAATLAAVPPTGLSSLPLQMRVWNNLIHQGFPAASFPFGRCSLAD